MRCLKLSVIVFALTASTVAQAQNPAPPAKPEAATSEAAENPRIRQLETDLSKLRDTSPEAAAVMVELIDAYHAEGRVSEQHGCGDARSAFRASRCPEAPAKAATSTPYGMPFRATMRDLVGAP